MTITIKIDDCNKKAHTLIEFLKSYSKDVEFVQIYQEENELTPEMDYEIQKRFEHIVAEPENGKSWDEVKKNLHTK